MRHLRKRITVINDGFCNCKKPADERVLAAALRYINKRSGWYPTFYSCGNSFAQYEAYVHMIKPKTTTEQEYARNKAIEEGWQFRKTVCIGKEWGNGYYK